MAVSRGRYDRTASQEHRRRDQREQLLSAGALLLSSEREAPSVRELIAMTRMGRNTFYEHFDDIGDLVDAVQHLALFRLTDPLRSLTSRAPTPGGREREFSETWYATAVAPRELVLALLGQSNPARERLRKHLNALFADLIEAAIRDGARSAPSEAVQLHALCCAVEGLTSYQLHSCPLAHPDEGARALGDLLSRMLR